MKLFRPGKRPRLRRRTRPRRHTERIPWNRQVPRTRPRRRLRRPRAAQPQPSYDLDEIWRTVFEEAEDIKGSFNLIRTGASLAGISDSDFKVIAHGEFVKTYLKENQNQICQLMENIVGRKLKMVIRSEGQQEEEAGPDQELEDLAARMSQELGMKVRVE